MSITVAHLIVPAPYSEHGPIRMPANTPDTQTGIRVRHERAKHLTSEVQDVYFVLFVEHLGEQRKDSR